MAVRPGEENVATLFADIHYFYGPPTNKPPHHRFDKGSYVYLFENANDRRARVEVANHPGTDDQDAFDGFLDNTRVSYTYRQQCVVNVAVDAVPGITPSDQHQWHLPTFDPHNQNKYHYKLHSLDIYFWTHDDALKFVNGIRRVLPPHQVEVADEPANQQQQPQQHQHHSQHSTDMTPLVQRLESVAIASPQPRQPQSGGGNIPSFDPPPTAPAQPTSAASGGGAGAPPSESSPASFAPMAYNPAAPAAPEQIKHREKTPPPPEEEGYDPLASAVARDHGLPPPTPGYGAHLPPTPGFPGGGPPPPPGGPPPNNGLTSPGFPPQSTGLTSPGFPPTQYANLQRSATMPVNSPGLVSPGLASPYGQQAGYPGSPGFPPQSPMPNMQQHLHHTQQQQHTPTPPPPQQQAVQSPGLPPQPVGGYAQFQYGQHQPQQPGQHDPYSIHQQAYRPTEQEHYANQGYKPAQNPNEKPSKLGQNAERFEKGVTGMLKKFEKKFG